MSDLISRQAAKDIIKNHKSDFSTEKDYRTARASVNAVPFAQPEVTEEAVKDYCRKRCLTVLTNDYFHKLTSTLTERKRGRWIEKEYSPFYCSVCGTYQYSASWEIKNKEYNFCPRCGADMRGDSND